MKLPGKFKFELGVWAIDAATGFVGLITARAEYTFEGRYYMLTPTARDESVQPSSEWIAESRVRQMKFGKPKLPVKAGNAEPPKEPKPAKKPPTKTVTVMGKKVQGIKVK